MDSDDDATSCDEETNPLVHTPETAYMNEVGGDLTECDTPEQRRTTPSRILYQQDEEDEEMEIVI